MRLTDRRGSSHRSRALALPLLSLVALTACSSDDPPGAPTGSADASCDAASAATLELTLADTGHLAWITEPTCLACGFCNTGGADPAEVRALIMRTTIAWLRRHLLDDPNMEPYLTGDVIQADAARGAMTLRSK